MEANTDTVDTQAGLKDLYPGVKYSADAVVNFTNGMKQTFLHADASTSQFKKLRTKVTYDGLAYFDVAKPILTKLGEGLSEFFDTASYATDESSLNDSLSYFVEQATVLKNVADASAAIHAEVVKKAVERGEEAQALVDALKKGADDDDDNNDDDDNTNKPTDDDKKKKEDEKKKKKQAIENAEVACANITDKIIPSLEKYLQFSDQIKGGLYTLHAKVIAAGDGDKDALAELLKFFKTSSVDIKNATVPLLANISASEAQFKAFAMLKNVGAQQAKAYDAIPEIKKEEEKGTGILSRALEILKSFGPTIAKTGLDAIAGYFGFTIPPTVNSVIDSVVDMVLKK